MAAGGARGGAQLQGAGGVGLEVGPVPGENSPPSSQVPAAPSIRSRRRGCGMWWQKRKRPRVLRPRGVRTKAELRARLWSCGHITAHRTYSPRARSN